MFKKLNKTLTTLVLVGMLAAGGIMGTNHIIEKQQIMVEAWKATSNMYIVKTTNQLITAWMTMDGVSDYSYDSMRENLLLIKTHDIKEVHLTMQNPGGAIIPMWSCYDMLKAAIDKGKFVLHTHAHNIIASAAVPLFLLGEVRTMQEHGYIMIHSHNVGQSEYRPESFNAMTASWTEAYIAILLERTTMGEEEIRKYLDNDGDASIQFWMNYDQAEARGFLTLQKNENSNPKEGY